MADRDDIAAYLTRLGVERRSPSVEALRELQRAHVERVPYETMWIHAGQRWTVDRDASLHRIAREGRGGYCFHLNGAFSLLLADLGYDVSLHVGGVHGPDGATDELMDNHLVLLVHGLPDVTNPDGAWYVDTGLGDALHEPMPLVGRESVQGPFRYGLSETTGGTGDWQFTHDPRGSFAGMAFRSPAVSIDAFVRRNEFLSTAPDSPFAATVTAQRRHADGIDVMRGLTLRHMSADGDSDSLLAARDDWFGALRELFGLHLDDMSPEERDRLWNRTEASHHAWQLAQALDSGLVSNGPAES